MKTVILVLTLCLSAYAGCPTYSECPIDGVGGYPTGAYRDQGARHFAQFAHSEHRWWVQCD